MRAVVIALATVLLLGGCAGKPVAVQTPTPTSRGTTYVFDKLGFAVTYDASGFKVETDKVGWPHGRYTDTFFVSNAGPHPADFFPNGSDGVEFRINPYGPPKQTVSALLRMWLASSPFQPPNGVHWRLASLNGMRGVTFETNIAGDRALNYVLYKNGLVIRIRADASGESAPVVWPALTDLARSFRATQ